jgi:hypothetical protein
MVRWEERAIRWLKRAGRRRPAPRGCRPRSRSRRSCRTSRGPPGDDPDEPADLAVPVRREAA